jgi:sugar lactone lactonase YvrE
MKKLALTRCLLALAGAFGLALVLSAPAQTAPVFSTPPPSGAPFAQPQKVVLADFNADGKADLATLGYQNGNTSLTPYLEIYLGNGDGTFASFPSAFTQVNGCAAVKGLAAYGRDITGALNLAVLCYDTLQIWHVAFDAGSQTTPIAFGNNPANRQVIALDSGGVAMAVGDFTGAGNPGIAVLELGVNDPHAGTIAVYPGTPPCPLCTSSSAFSQLITQSLAIHAGDTYDPNDVGTALAAIQVPPFNAAGLVVATTTLGTCGGKLVSFFFDGNSFILGDVSTIPPPYCPSSIAAGDLDGDSFTDVVVGGSSTSGSGFLMTFVGSSDAVFGPVSPTPFTATAPAPNDSGEMAILDLNGDGFADLVVAGPQPNGISTRSATVNVYLGNGDFTFGIPSMPGPDVSGAHAVGLSKGVLSIGVGNINLDGSPELATVDLVGDGSGGDIGNLSSIPGSFVQTFTNRTTPTTVTLTAGIASSPEATSRSLARSMATQVHPRYFGSGATALLTTVSPASATGWVQFFDATTQTWLGSAQLSEGTATLTVKTTGSHFYIASYYGSDPYQGSSSDAQPIAPAKQPSNTSLDVSPSTAAPGAPITFSSTVNGSGASPTGTVTFVDNNTGNTLATATLDGSGFGTVTLTTLPVDYYDIVANYAGDLTYKPSSSFDIALTIAVPLIPDTLSLTATPLTSTYGTDISATATIVSSGNATPSGDVLFQIDGVILATATLQAGKATTTLHPPAGQHQLQVIYAGDGVSTPAVSNALALTIHGGVLQLTPGAATLVAGVPGASTRYGFGGDGGPALQAHLHTPVTVSTHNGSIYIADEENNVIRKVAPDGTISTVAGIPYAGSIYNNRFGGDGGQATDAYLDFPTGIAFDAAGNLYIADYGNNVVRRVDAVTGIISTYAGDPANRGYNQDSGPAKSTWLSNPTAIAFDAAGNLFIADKGNNLVRKVDTNGTMTTVAGHYGYSSGPSYGGPANVSTLNQPEGIAVDASGNLYIADTRNSVVAKVDTTGIVTRFAGGNYSNGLGDGLPATSASVNNPFQLSLDAAGDLYIMDSGNSVVRKVDTFGIITTVAGIPGSSSSGLYDPAGAPATGAGLTAPSGVAVEPSGSLLVADTFDQTIWRVGVPGAVVFGVQAAGTTSLPQTVTLSNVGDLPINFQATPFTVTGDYTVTSEGTSPCVFSNPLAVGASCTIAIRYRPATTALSGVVAFATDTSGSATINLRTNTSVLPTTIDLEFSTSTPQAGDSLLIYAAVNAAPNTAPPSGTFSFYEGGTLLGTATTTSTSGSSYGYILTSTLPVGPHTITASYSGDGNYGASTSDPSTVTVTPIATAIALTANASSITFGSSITFTAAVTIQSPAAPLTTGRVTFSDGATILGTVNVDGAGTATLTTTSLSSGSRSITAQYLAQGNYATSTSTPVAVTVTGGGGGAIGFDYTIDANGVPVTIHRGDAATLGLTINSINPSPGAVTLACGTLPRYATCNFSPSTVQLNGSQQQSIVWTITTTPAP